MVRLKSQKQGQRQPLLLAEDLEVRREYFETVLRAAEQRLLRFSRRHDWSHLLAEPFYNGVEIYSDKRLFDKRLIQLYSLTPDTPLAKTFSATLEQRCLVAVSPELYRANYPEGSGPGSYEKLLTHELAHHLHIRILDGVEDEMGPIWFFEGFAVVAAGQFARDRSGITASQIKEYLEDETERKSYRMYGRIIRYLLRRWTLPELVNQARSPGFTAWTIDRILGEGAGRG